MTQFRHFDLVEKPTIQYSIDDCTAVGVKRLLGRVGVRQCEIEVLSGEADAAIGEEL